MLKKRYLLTPGPTPVPPESLLAMAKPIIHHRTKQFRSYLAEATKGMQEVFQTKNQVITLASSGTGAMEAAISNLLSQGDKALVVSGGKFGQRWGQICKAYGIEANILEVEWGKAIDPNIIKEELENDADIKAVFTTLCETSTGVRTDIKAVAQITKNHQAIQITDAISALGAEEMKMDEWGIDVVVTGSQKGLMMPPGLAFIALNEKAWKLSESSKLPKYYFNLTKAKKSLEGNDTPWTPAVNLVIGLVEALKLMQDEGIDNVIKRHEALARATREAVMALGLELLAPDSPSNVVTAVKLPSEIDGIELVKKLRDEYDVWVAGGQADLKGKIIRIAHLGYMNKFDTIVGISALEMVLKEMNYKFELGSGIKKAEEILAA
jgi:aspartate aminotransferase-like enzyme